MGTLVFLGLLCYKENKGGYFMSARVLDCLNDKNGNYILPFFWQHGETEEVLREYMRAICDANIREVCLEARPHPDYAGEQWFHDVDIILDEAKKLGMKLWILDDAHFPSGQAAGKMADAPAELCKQFLNYTMVDVCGPVPQTAIHVAKMAKDYPNPFAQASIFAQGEKRRFDDDALFAVIASRLDGKPGDIYHLDDTLLDLTSAVDESGWLSWDVPKGSWRVFVIYQTRNGGGRSGYVNFLSRKSCRVQIDACYEPHYERYKEEFGETILGFFSDEPEIGNVIGYDGATAGIGNMTMPLPWSDEMPALMEERFGKDYARKIVALWMNVGSEAFTADVRCGYMDIVTRQCQRNFGEQIGDWCREHGVEYIGHIVEDCDMSPKLGASQGHFFRALWGQDWAGIDDIGGQVTLGGANISHKTFMGSAADGEFYHHELGKLGTSLADIDPKKKGRSMCEIFGAYGWDEGTRLMKYEMDHFLVRGINHYVPHAFSPKEFPDPDCPPHFYAHGKNPLYAPFGHLMKYANRVCHLINGGRHEVDVAVLYHAESEWAGGDYMDVVKPARVLDDAQIDFDFIPADVFSVPEDFMASFDGKCLEVAEQCFKALVIPGADFVPQAVLDFAGKAKNAGFPVFFVEKVPDGADRFEVTPLGGLADALREAGLLDAVSDVAFADLQVYHYSHADAACYLISNESASEVYKGNITLPVSGVPYVYDALENKVCRTAYETAGGGVRLDLTIEPYQLVIVVIPTGEDTLNAIAVDAPVYGGTVREVSGPWKVSFVENECYPQFGDVMQMEVPENVLKHRPDFSGVIRYESTFEGSAQLVAVEDAYESAEVWINEKYAGMRICPPYRFDVGSLCEQGENRLRIEVRTTLERKVNKITGGMGPFGPEFGVVMPSGIIGRVTVI